MPVTILGDKQVDDLLHSLTVEEVRQLQLNLASTLHDYSTGGPETANQPERQAVQTSYGTSLFMPSVGRDAVGVKVVCLNTQGPSSSTTPTATSTNPTPSGGGSGDDSGKKGDDDDKPPMTRPRGTLTLLDKSGEPRGWLAATTLTAFRTALAATFLFSKRSRVHTLLVFGAGAQAYWHIRLALLLRGSDIHHVHIVSRSFASAEKLFRTILTDERWAALRTAYKGGRESVEFTLLSGEFGEYERVLKERVRAADAVFGCTPSTEALFPPEWLTASEGRKKARFVSLVGSYRPDMVELHPDVLRQQVGKDQDGGSPRTRRRWHFHKHIERGGVIVVDSLEACLRESGEIIQAGLLGEDLVEVGELIMVRRKEREEAEIADGDGNDSGLRRWIEGGNVIYKSVGVGLMDISVGTGVLDLAKAKGVGTTLDDF